MNGLPRPVTTDHEYLAAILDALRDISAKLDRPAVENVTIVEPAPVPSGELVQAVDEQIAKATRSRARKG
jgi:hypothetical protein